MVYEALASLLVFSLILGMYLVCACAVVGVCVNVYECWRNR